MGLDQRLAIQLPDLLAKERKVTEKKMFGGLAFLVNGNMCVRVLGKGAGRAE